MTIEKTTERLEKLYAHYTKDVELLTEKRARIQAALDEAQIRMLQTFDAVQALKGKPTLNKIIEKMDAQENGPQAKIIASPSEIPQNGNQPEGLPPAEPGMRWAKNEANEDVLVPINIPKPLVVSGVKFSGEDDFALPTVEEDGGFDSPESFLS